jgi:hypothetical protein
VGSNPATRTSVGYHNIFRHAQQIKSNLTITGSSPATCTMLTAYVAQ